MVYYTYYTGTDFEIIFSHMLDFAFYFKLKVYYVII